MRRTGRGRLDRLVDMRVSRSRRSILLILICVIDCVGGWIVSVCAIPYSFWIEYPSIIHIELTQDLSDKRRGKQILENQFNIVNQFIPLLSTVGYILN